MFDTLLIANRGEIACRIARSARAMGLTAVAVYSDADRDAPHVHAADLAVRLPGVAPADTYLRADLLLAAARRTGAQAVHPGYGFLSEDAAFAEACGAAGLVFVGPSPAAIAAMGNKVSAKERMAAAGVPVLPGATITAEVSPEAIAAAGASVGYPLLVKAAFGGGGRGMRIVATADELVGAVASAQREAAAAFGDGLVFLERYVERPRHIEVQVFADTHGTVVHLFERECSIQRRHQKVIEEAPSPFVDAEMRQRLGAAAVAAATAIGYVGAGTVEFVADQDGQFFFLEMNTRLQVEHPVTELVTGLDLVRAQLEVAAGQRLPEEFRAASLHGHAVEARLYAEDATRGYLPSTGRLHGFDPGPIGDGVRIDSGYTTGSTVTPHYDAMLAKVIAWGADRDEAVHRLARALGALQVRGVVTNRDLLVATLRHPEFLAGRTDTGFYERHDPAQLGADPTTAAAHRTHAVAAAIAGASRRVAERAASGAVVVPAGMRTVGAERQAVTFERDGVTMVVEYRQRRDGAWEAWVDGVACELGTVHVELDGMARAAVDLECDGLRGTVVVDVDAQSGAGANIVTMWARSPLGDTTMRVVPRFTDPGSSGPAGSLRSPLPGSVVRVDAVVGATVGAGDALVALEAMKMEHVIRAPHAGTVTIVLVGLGDHVDAGAVLVVIDEEAP